MSSILLGSTPSPQVGQDFTISLRCGWDGKDDAALGARLAAYGEAGVDHVLVEPAERALEDWLRTVEWVARAAEGIQP